MLVHKLGKLARAEEFFNSGNDGFNINQYLWGNNIGVLGRHSVFNHPFHTG